MGYTDCQKTNSASEMLGVRHAHMANKEFSADASGTSYR
jgi:hypothetical protein